MKKWWYPLALERLMPRPRLRDGAEGKPRRPVRSILVFGRVPNPTFDYYLPVRLEAAGMPPHQVHDIRRFDPAGLDPDGAFVVVCRYASKPLLAWIEAHADRLAGVGLLLDDDIHAVISSRDADIAYSLFLWYRALHPLRRLNRHLDIIWLSTPQLVQAIGEPKAHILPPAPPASLWERRPKTGEGAKAVAEEKVVIAYHATGVHVAEHHFLKPVIRKVLEARPQTVFEVFAGKKARQIWRGMDRVTVKAPVSWPQYLVYAGTAQVDIMLVPLAPSEANDSRAGTKFIDVARLGAAGLFSDALAYDGGPQDAHPRLPYDERVWIEEILRLVDDPEMRAARAADIAAKVAQMSRSFAPLFPEL
ncbi:glycosyltransferase family protein [Allorhizobium taibaishanense]|uniref:Glycosyltransferase n=1 Tax=Allorhizobium taibaishanense TaxID=887144 RepID=A0A1Q8ZZJ8_9HYPH|nr:hypothetical protein [Allorhizobium taibaishanense]MBB4007434.1 hypothetical protein [Allorhizobium taibaishanense]OLP47609.1 hypothetical protein BJF91_04205 [Allorhizobium taibaishanense]